MYFLYLDETGTTLKNKHFVLGGLMINVTKWQEINKKITDLKSEYFSTVYIDLKGLRRHKQETLDGKNKNPFFGMDEQKREDFSKKLKQIILKEEFTYIAAVINKEEHNKKYSSPEDYYLLSYEFIIERFDKFLQDRNEYGIIFIEFANVTLKQDLEKSHKKFLEDGTKFQEVERIIESCNFVVGPKNNFVQVADLFIGGVFSAAEYEKKERYLEYQPFMYKSPYTGKINGYGIKYFPL